MLLFKKINQGQLLLLLGLCLVDSGCYAASVKNQSSSQINYAYMNYLGTGVYSAADRSVQVYHLPFSYKIDEAKVDKRGIMIRLPATIGLLDFKARDIPIEAYQTRLKL